MEVFYYKHSLLPADGNLAVSTIVRRTKLFKNSREFEDWINKGYVEVRGREKITEPNQPIKIKDDMVINIRYKGGVRVRLTD